LGDAEEIAHRQDELRERDRREYEAALPPDDPALEHATRWYSKQGVQTIVVEHLIETGWSLRWVGDPLKRDRLHPVDLDDIGEPIHDLEAERDGVELFVEVIGHPGSLDGPYDGQARQEPGFATQGSSGAEARYSDALGTAPELRDRYPDARIVQAYPAQGMYRTYAPRAYGGAHMRRDRVELGMINEDGTVKEHAETDC
jgi:hypothetical protein